MSDKEKLVELLADAGLGKTERYFLADHLLANGVTIQRWVSVEERLPDETKDEYVFVVCDYHGKGNRCHNRRKKNEDVHEIR